MGILILHYSINFTFVWISCINVCSYYTFLMLFVAYFEVFDNGQRYSTVLIYIF